MRAWILSLLVLLAAPASAAHLLFTAPPVGQHRWTAWDPEVNDSTTHVDCGGGDSLRETLWVVLYRQLLTGGGYAPIDSHMVTPGSRDSFPDQGPGHYVVVARNSAGTGCFPERPYTLLPPDVTGVTVSQLDPDDYVVVWRLYSVTGRKVKEIRERVVSPRELLGLPSGMYYRKGWTKKRRVVIGPPLWVVR